MGDLAGRPLVWNIVKIKVLGIYSHFIFRFISLLCLRSRLLLLGKLNWWFLTHTWAWQLSTCSSMLYHNTVKRKREYVMSSNHFRIQYFKWFIATRTFFVYLSGLPLFPVLLLWQQSRGVQMHFFQHWYYLLLK